MDTNKLKKFAQEARRVLMGRVKTKLDLVLAEDSAARRERPAAVRDLENKIRELGKAQVIEQVAYTWFNRFTALQYMDMNGYNRVRVIAPAEGQTRPEILSEATAGIFNEDLVSENTKNVVSGLLDGRSASNDPENEAYRHLVVSACNYWHKSMPYMFEKILDFTELLMPEDLLSATSILTSLREVMTEDVCKDVEVIGWLYQFYISEKKDDVFAGLKKNQKITPENIPAATQLFTPHWIVRYLVENSLGRLWMLNRPQSKLAEQMEYYIKPEEPETDFIKIGKPQELKICDPACGSGHMLTYAFDLLHAIYEEEGFDPKDIPEFILEHNLTGIEIDERAGSLASFALAMKAAEKLGRRRFLRMETKPEICVLQNVSFEPSELQDIEAMVGRSLFTADLRATLTQFEQAKNFGSLIIPKLKDPQECLRVIEAQDLGGDMFRAKLRERLLTVLRMSEALSSKYHVVVANPPYMGGKGLNGQLGDFLKNEYKDVKSDVFSAFMVRNTYLAVKGGQLGFMTPFVWMFISSYEKLRIFLLEQKTITSLIQLEYSGFDGATVPICTFTIENKHCPEFRGGYVRLSDFRGAKNQAPKTLEAVQNPNCGWFYRASANDFEKIPGSPIAYWVSQNERQLYSSGHLLAKTAMPRKGIDTGENAQFLRLWFETPIHRFTSFGGEKWTPYNKGGEFRRWYGNREWVVDWENEGQEIKARLGWKSRKPTIRNEAFFRREGFTWTTISSGGFSARYTPADSLFDNGGCTLFADQNLLKLGAFLNSTVMSRYLEFLSPTLNFQPGDIGTALFLPACLESNISSQQSVNLSKSDWDAYETSWEFTTLPLLSSDHRGANIAETYAKLRSHWQSMTDEMQRLEEENNKIFIDAYGLQDELTPEVPIDEITLTCNPHYRYGGNMTNEEREARLLSDTMAEFLSYAVGCMFGRYSLDKPGLVLANQGETLADYLAQVPEPTFEPDEDNVIPMLDGDWFSDDITERFRKFLRVTFGEEKFQENLRFIETALGKDIRKYFTKDFYGDHVKRYKKRPIYWMFSSPKGSFNALIYLHRYNRDTVSVLLDRYVREFKVKLSAQKSAYERVEISSDASQGEKTKAIKEIQKINSIIEELDAWERDVIFPLASQRIEIDLDDGVKANYPKFGTALKSIGI
ncbi:BREX-1 system adenine-specific DNA-methyltransferase PglX [Marivivens sp. JLT3646]|uniref:BREX-1 system adenine-specific DNA-methyltransferase PglX n=1 Tax=Marivivens sp. JLT3646 TaxID=1920883 RepID=UPI0007FFC523|nr:BREX-1 system adenine-specific DNA-methyltransferase PglX [Marivivens sp. JLT3646]APO85853.1 SAM-dependent methyltransferase [Marivivens sp. JLT3646]OBR37055.1 type II restriction endonuclease [Donghicola sp. JL3646]